MWYVCGILLVRELSWEGLVRIVHALLGVGE